MSAESNQRYSNKGHVWELSEYGDINFFAYGSGFHNGPRCTVCGYGFCHHCKNEPEYTCQEYQEKNSRLK